jgi:hypothetical protein
MLLAEPSRGIQHRCCNFMRPLAAVILLCALAPSWSQRPFQGPPQTEIAWIASAGNGTQEGDLGAIVLLREALATSKAQRSKLHWVDSDPCGSPSCNATCNWQGLVCRYVVHHGPLFPVFSKRLQYRMYSHACMLLLLLHAAFEPLTNIVRPTPWGTCMRPNPGGQCEQ